MISAIIVEDEKVSRNVLAGYIKKYCPGIQLIGEAANIDEAQQLIDNLKPQLVFLDIEMPKGNGFDLLERYPETNFEVIFVTAFNDYAIQAFNCSAAYYLLKPISIDELVKAVDKIKQLLDEKTNWSPTKVLLENIRNAIGQDHKIALPLLNGFEVVKTGDIIRCQANDNFTEFYFVNGKKMMICRTLKFYEELLKDHGFLRVHKSHLVNKNHIKRYTKGKGGSLTMADNSSVDVSSTYKDSLQNKFI